MDLSESFFRPRFGGDIRVPQRSNFCQGGSKKKRRNPLTEIAGCGEENVTPNPRSQKNVAGGDGLILLPSLLDREVI